MKVYGITGSIACGKSTVTHYLIERGYLVVDADLISRNALTIDQECILKVQELFGCVKDGIVDRKALGRIVFHDKNAKKQLEAIIHPYVILKMKEEIEKNKDTDADENKDQNTQQAAETAASAENAHPTYVIRPGDTLYQISIRCYGNAEAMEEICKLNGISANEIIYPGQVIVLP